MRQKLTIARKKVRISSLYPLILTFSSQHCEIKNHNYFFIFNSVAETFTIRSGTGIKVIWVRLDLNRLSVEILFYFLQPRDGEADLDLCPSEDVIRTRSLSESLFQLKTGCSYFCRPWRRSFRHTRLSGVFLQASARHKISPNSLGLTSPRTGCPQNLLSTNIGSCFPYGCACSRDNEASLPEWFVSWNKHEGQSCSFRPVV